MFSCLLQLIWYLGCLFQVQMQKNIKIYTYIADASLPRFLENDASASPLAKDILASSPLRATLHEISKTQKSFGEIPPGWRDIKIINIFNETLSLNSGKLKY